MTGSDLGALVMQAQPAIMRSRLTALLALFLFFIVGFFGSLPLLTLGGEAAGYIKEAFFLLVFFRLAWCAYKRTLRWRDYFVYFALVIGFCIWWILVLTDGALDSN
ncbi:MAG: hypothetical protein WDN00_19010 [Limisphaerales bacterium]